MRLDLRTKAVRGLAHGRLLSRFDIFTPARVKEREGSIARAKVSIAAQYSSSLFPGKAHIAISSDNIEIGPRAAAAKTHRCIATIQHLWNHRAGGPSHGRWHVFVDARHRLADDKPLLSVSKQNHHFRIERKLSQRSIDYVLYFTFYYR